MITEQQYLEAKKIVETWLNSQPKDPEYPYKPKLMSKEDYCRQRALNETLRLFAEQETVSYEAFGKILDRFDLGIFTAPVGKSETVAFIRWHLVINAFTGEKVPSDYKLISHLVNKLKDNDPNGQDTKI